MTKRFLMLALAGALVATALVAPAAAANTIPCDLDGDGYTGNVEAAGCFGVGIVLWVTFETAQCATQGDSDICVLP